MLNSADRILSSALFRALLPAVALVALFPAQAMAGPMSQTFSGPGETAFTVPANVNQIHIDAVGAHGGGTGNVGGAGAEVQGDLVVTPGQTLYFEVGIGGGTAHYIGGATVGGEGGGESDVRTCSVNASSCSVPGYGPVSSSQTQLLVAAGGGGSGAIASDPNFPGAGGDAGLLNADGADGKAGTNANGGQGATQSGNGLGGSSTSGGPSGAGGSGNVGGDGFAGGGAGGAGRFGGGAGGGIGVISQGSGGGGGGSSWVNQDATGVGAFLTHITGASSAAAPLSTPSAQIVISYTPIQKAGPIPSIRTPAAQQLVGPYPEFSGRGGSNPGDQQSVTVSIYNGQATTGTPVQTFSTPLDPAHWYDAPANSALASGTYTAVIAQQNSAGDTGSSAVTFAVDATGPALTFTGPADGSLTNAPQVTFTGNLGTDANDNASALLELYAGRNDAGMPIAWISPLVSGGQWTAETSGPLADGVYFAVVQQADSFGNATTRTATFTVDSAKPTVSVTTPADGATYHVGDHLAAAYTCADASSGVASCAGPVPAGGAVDTTSPGQHAFTVQATDKAGNPASTTVHYTVLAAGQPAVPGPAAGQPTMPGTTAGQGHPSGPSTTRAPAGLRVKSAHLGSPARGCTQHPRPRNLSARACSAAVVVTGVVDPRAAGHSLSVSWTDGRGHTVHGTVKVGRGGRWAIKLALPQSARAHPGSVTVSYAGDAVLAPGAVSRKVVA